MPLAALEKGTDWDWHGFGDYLSRFDGGLGVNAGFLVGHCALRRRVMGADAVGETATPEQIESMRALLGESLEAGGLGLSTSRAFTHDDGDGEPVPSRHATPPRCSRSAKRWRGTPGRRSRRSPTAASMGSATTKSICSRACRSQPSAAELERAHDRRRRSGPHRASARGVGSRRRRPAAGSLRSRCRSSSA